MAGDLTVGQLRVILEADSSKFAAAMKDADATSKKLSETLRKELEPSTRGTNAAFKDFIGVNAIKRAREMVDAVKRLSTDQKQLDGVTKLNEASQKKLNAAVVLAISHYKALGKEAPADMLKIAAATTKAEQATAAMAKPVSVLDSAVKMIGPRIVAAFSVGAVVGFAKAIVATAGRIQDLSEKMDVSAETTQRWESHFKESGVTIEQVSDSVTFMQRAIATNSDAAKGAARALGLELSNLRAMPTKDAFEAIAEAIRGIEDPMEQVRIGTILLGRGFDEMLPGIRAGVKNAGDQFSVMSNEAVSMLDTIGDALAKFGPRFKAQIANNIVGPLREWHEWQQRLNPGKVLGAANIAAGIPTPGIFSGGLPSVLPDQAGINARLKEQDRINKLTEKGIETSEAYGKRLAELFLISRALDKQVRENADGLRMFGGEAGLTNLELMALVGRLDDLHAKGAKLPPELEAIRVKFGFFRDLVKATRIEFELLDKTPAFRQFNRDAEIQRRSDFFGGMGPLAMPGPVVPLQNQINLGQLDKPIEKWDDALRDVIDSFEDLASIAGDTFSDITRGAGSAVSSALMLHDGFNKISSAKTFAGTLTGIAGIIGGLGQAIELGKLLHDALTRSEGEKSAADLRRGFGAFDADLGSIGEDDPIVKQITALVKRFEVSVGKGIGKVTLGQQLTRGEAADILMPELVKRAGGIDSGNFAGFAASTTALFDTVAKGGEIGEMALKSLDEMLGLLGDHLVEQGGLWDAHFIAMLERAKAEGLELASVMELVKGQLDIAAGGLNRTVTGTKPDDQGDFDRMSRLALATFNAFIANGQSAAQAIDAIGPSIDALKQSVTDFGFAGNDAFNQLSRWRDLVSANQPLLDSLAGLNEMMVALANVGALDAQTFADMQAQGLDTFNSLTAAGFSQNEALAQMKPMLENLRRLHKERGLAIDAETQALIDQAEQQGILAEEGQSTNDVLMDGLGRIIELLGGELPDAWRKMADSAKDAVDDIDSDTDRLKRKLVDRFKDIEFDINYRINDPEIGPNAGGGPAPEFHRGGAINAGAGMWAKLQGKEWIVPDHDFQELIGDFSTQPSLPSASMVSALSGIAGEIRSAADAPIYLMADSRVLGEVSARSDSGAASRFGLMRS